MALRSTFSLLAALILLAALCWIGFEGSAESPSLSESSEGSEAATAESDSRNTPVATEPDRTELEEKPAATFLVRGRLFANEQPLVGVGLVVRASDREQRVLPDSGGRFEFESPVPDGARVDLALASETWVLWNPERHRRISRAVLRDGVELFLHACRPIQVTGYVMDRDGKRVGGATVRISYPQVMGTRSYITGTESAADGSFRYRTLPRAGPLEIAAETDTGEGSKPLRLALRDGQDVSELVLRLLPAARIQGSVRREDGAALAGVGLEIERHVVRKLPRPYRQSYRIESTAKVTSDAEGRYASPGLPAGRYRVILLPRTLSTASELIDLGVGETREGVDLVIPSAQLSSIAGRVITSSGRKGVPGLRVYATPPHIAEPARQTKPPVSVEFLAGSVRSDETDDAGRFQITDLKPGKYELYADPANRAARPWLRCRRGPRQSALAGSRGIELVFDWIPWGSVRGRIQTPDGRTPDHVDVAIVRPGSPPIGSFRHVPLADAAFRLSDVSAGSFELFLGHPDYQEVKIPIQVLADRETDIGVVRLRGHGLPMDRIQEMQRVPGDWIRRSLKLVPEDPPQSRASYRDEGFLKRLQRHFGRQQAVVDFDWIPAGRYRIEVWAEDSRPASKHERMGLETRSVTLQAGQFLSVDWSRR